jgi:diadenosine tetraphosphate (Ap4A) HIT family hydrolase
MKSLRNLATGASQSACEFCSELRSPLSSRFYKVYGAQQGNRIIAEKDGIVAFPTIGQLFRGSLLILPRSHFETVADLPSGMLMALAAMLEYLESKVARLGTPIIFEHGARCDTGGGCGIYHAHLHLVPVPGDVYCSDVFPEVQWVRANLFESYDLLRGVNDYLLFRDVRGMFAGLTIGNRPSSFYHSQYFRRVLANHFGLTSPWDWRAYFYKERWLIETLNYLGAQSVPVRR